MADRHDPERYAEQSREMLDALDELGEEHADFVDRNENTVGNILDYINEHDKLSEKQADLLDNIKREIEEKTRSVY